VRSVQCGWKLRRERGRGKYLRLAGEIVCGGGERGIRGGRTGSGGSTWAHTPQPGLWLSLARSPSSFSPTPPIPSLTLPSFTSSPVTTTPAFLNSFLFIERTHSTTAVSNHHPPQKTAAISNHPQKICCCFKLPPENLLLFQQFIST
jgi:hypothetical protein